MGNDVWIGCGVVILSGVSIGDGAIIGAGAVVTKDVLPYAIVGGCPARQIRMRVENQDMVKRLQNLAWWEWSESSLRDCLALFQSELDLHILEEFEKYKELMKNENSGSNSCKSRF